MYRNKRYRGRGSINNVGQSKSDGFKQPTSGQSHSQSVSVSVLKSIDENLTLRTTQKDDDINVPRKIIRLDVHKNMDDDDNDILSQGSVPSSQPKTQRRYLSQRGTLLAGLSRTQSISYNSGNNYFEVVLIKLGVDFEDPDTYILNCDHVTFANNLRSILKKNPDFPENLKQFLDGFKEAIEEPKTKLKLLTCCTIKISNNTNETSYLSQDSLIVNFLMIEFLHKEILEILLDEIKKSATNDKKAYLQSVPLLPLFLSQLKFSANIHGNMLYDNIMNTFEISTKDARKHICENAEFIFEASNHDSFVKYLIENTTSNKELLTKVNVKTFTNLYLSQNVEKQLSSSILNYMKENPNVQNFPHLVQFLVKVKNENENDLKELIADLRSALDKLEINMDNNAEVEDLKKTFMYIHQGLIKSKKLYDICQKYIQNRSENEVKAVDLILFLFLISIREDKSFYIENLIRRQVKLERIDTNLLSEAKNKYLPVLNSECIILLRLLNNFLKDKNLTVSDFAKNSYSIIFGIGDSIQKNILSKLVDLACNRAATSRKTLALGILNSINNGYSKEVQNFGMLLPPMLDQINEIDLNQTRTILKLLSSIAYPLPCSIDDSSSNNLQDHINMIVMKQIVNRSTLIKKQGIIGTIQIVDCIARTEQDLTENNDDIYALDKSFITVNSIPEGNGREAATHISKIFSSCNYCPETLGLFYTELANVFSYKNPKFNTAGIDRYFLIWLRDIITNYFETNFVVDQTILDKNFEIDLKYHSCLNELEEDESSSPLMLSNAIDIAGPVLDPSAQAHNSIIILCSLFHATVTLHKISFHNNLESLNAVLGFALILPKCFGESDIMDIFDEYDENMSKKILDMHFHVINWYRTIINAYVGQRNDKSIRNKIIKRINNLIETEQIVRELLKKVSVNYVPPLCDFFNSHLNTTISHPQGKPKPSTSKKNVESETEKIDANVGTMTILAQTQNANNQTIKVNKIKNIVKNKFDIIYGPKEIYREFDSDIILILEEEIRLNIERNNENELFLGLSEFQFVMNDLVSKIESVDGIKKIVANPNLQEIIYLKDFLEKCGKYLPKIVKIFKKICNEINSKLDEINNELGHIDLFTDRMNYLKITMGLCLRFLTAFFSYSGFIDNPEYKIIFNQSLQLICGSDSKNVFVLSSAVITLFLVYEKNMIDLRSSVYFYQLIKTLIKFSQKDIHNKKIRELSKKFLCRKWFSCDGQIEKGAICNVLLDYLIKGFLKDSNFKRISQISAVIVEECSLLKKNDGFLTSFPNIHKANFPMLYKELCENLLVAINEKIATKLSDISLLKLWEENCKTLDSLLNIVKKIEIPRNFSLYLKYSHQFIKLFLLNGLPILERSLRQNPELCNNLLINLQSITRYLHNLCCHSKKNKNTAIITQIPLIRETVEILLIKVKAALIANKVGSAFWMGNLKNKDIHGEEIKEQESLDENEINNSDGEIPGDDESIDESVNSDVEDNVAPPTKQNSRSRCF